MKIAHFSDLHYSESNLIEADRCFGFAVEEAIRRKVQVAFVTGDSTDHQLEAHSPAYLQLARRIQQLANHCPVFMLQGTFSHEPVGMLHMFALIGANHPIVISDHIEMIGLRHGKWEPFDTFSDDLSGYDLVVSSVPTVNKADLVSLVGVENANEAMGDHLAYVMNAFNEVNGKLRALGIPTVMVSHGTVDGSMNENGVPMAGLDHEFTLGALYSANTDAVMLGHIHKHQHWERLFRGVKQVIAYPGSCGRYHYGELGEKYFLDWNVEPGNASFEAIATPARRMIDLDFDGMPNLDEIAAVASQCAGAFVRVSYSVDEEHAKTIDRAAIKTILTGGGAVEVKIVGEVLTIQRQRCAGITSLSSTVDRFLKWCEYSGTSNEGLVERLQLLESMEPADIASNFAKLNKGLTKSEAEILAESDLALCDQLF